MNNNSVKNIFYNEAEEEVLKLNLNSQFKINYLNNKDQNKLTLKDFNESKKLNSLTFLKFNLKNKKRKFSLSQSSKNNSFFLQNIEQEFSSLNDISKSIKKLEVIVLNLLDKINNDNSKQILSAPRFQHINYENYLHNLLKDLNKKEKLIKINKEILEKELKTIDETISDKELSIDILINMDSFKKMFNQKMVKHYENEFNKKEEEHFSLSNINNTNTNNSFFNFNNSINNNSTIPSFMKKKMEKINKKGKDPNIKLFKIQHLLRAKAFRAKLNNYILKNMEKTTKKAEQLENEVNKQKINKKLISEKLLNINQKLKIFHTNKKNIIDKLYIHYLTILKNGTDTREEGLAWVICEILNLGKKVMMSFLPKYLDANCVLFLFEMAHLLKKMKNLEKKFYELKNIFSDKSKKRNSIKEEIDIKKYLVSQKSLKNIREKFLRSSLSSFIIKKISSNDKTKVKKSISHPLSLQKRRASAAFMSKVEKKFRDIQQSFVNGDPNHYYGENETEIPREIKFKDIDRYTSRKNIGLLKEDKTIKFKECIELSKEIEKLKKIKNDLKNKEMCRIFEEFRKNKYYEKYNVDKKTLINALIGEDNLMTEMYNQNKKEKQLNDEILKTRLFKKEFFKKNILYMNNTSLNLRKFYNFHENDNLKLVSFK